VGTTLYKERNLAMNKRVRFILNDTDMKYSRDLYVTEVGEGRDKHTAVDTVFQGKTEFQLIDHGDGVEFNGIELDYTQVADLYLAIPCMMEAGRNLMQCEISRPVKKIGRRQ
jgi:UDP-N-acetylmuramyl pentapeptide synthase